LIIRIFLAGEGPNELGSWAKETNYRDPKFPGVVETLLRRICSEGWQITEAIAWKSIRKLRVNEHGNAEVRNIRGLVLFAKEHKCQAVAFARDRDRSSQREQDVEDGIKQAKDDHPTGPAIIGGVAIERLESWLVAFCGKTKSETIRKREEVLAELRIKEKDTGAMVELVLKADFNRIPEDAQSLRLWINRAKKAFSEKLPPEIENS
jgi:hypothetical protein